MEKKSTVSKVVHNTRQWMYQGTKMYVHQIRFENGDSGDYSSKSETCTAFQEGKEALYTIEENAGYAPKIKPVKEQPQQSNAKGNYAPKNERLIVAQTCIKSACELNAEKGGSAGLGRIEEVIKDAERLFDWCIKKSQQ